MSDVPVTSYAKKDGTRVDIGNEERSSMHFPSAEDLMIAKAIAGREKDLSWIAKLVRDGLADKQKTENLLDKLPSDMDKGLKALVAIIDQ